MEKTNIFLFSAALVLVLIIVSGVNGCGKATTDTSTTGLAISFVKDAPPVSVVVGKAFPIKVDVLNEGGEFVNKGQAKFYLSGLGQNFENVKSTLTNEKTLSKESIFPETLTFAEGAKYTFPLQELTIVPLVLTACYDYSGRAQATLCISATNESKVCSLSGEKINSNTAGPVQISGVSETVLRNKLIVSFDILNKGKGEVFLSDTNCDKLELNDFTESQKQKKLALKITTRDNFKCKMQSESGQIEGLEGIVPIGKVVCEKDISNEDYSSVFTLDFRYKYREAISQSISVLPAV